MTEMWDQWKKGFYAWESTTAEYMESVLKNPAVLGPSGHMLSGAMKARAKGELMASRPALTSASTSPTN